LPHPAWFVGGCDDDRGNFTILLADKRERHRLGEGGARVYMGPPEGLQLSRGKVALTQDLQASGPDLPDLGSGYTPFGGFLESEAGSVSQVRKRLGDFFGPYLGRGYAKGIITTAHAPWFPTEGEAEKPVRGRGTGGKGRCKISR